MVYIVCNKICLIQGGGALHRGEGKGRGSEQRHRRSGRMSKVATPPSQRSLFGRWRDLEFEGRVPTPPSNSRFRKLLKSATWQIWDLYPSGTSAKDPTCHQFGFENSSWPSGKSPSKNGHDYPELMTADDSAWFKASLPYSFFLSVWCWDGLLSYTAMLHVRSFCY